jgi:hypothetical protein
MVAEGHSSNLRSGRRKREDAMKRVICASAVAVLAGAGSASAQMVLHMDVNSIRVQVRDGAGTASAFGGLSHTGSINFSFDMGVTSLVAVQTQNGSETPVNQNFTGSLSNFTGVINLVNGQVTGGNLSVNVDSNDTYTADVTPNAGAVSTFVGGGFKVEGLTFNGMFTDSMFGNVNIAQWFSSQGQNGGLLGSFLQFNFSPNQTGASHSDMDIFVNAQVIPLPPAAMTGIATLAGIMVAGYIRRRR